MMRGRARGREAARALRIDASRYEAAFSTICSSTIAPLPRNMLKPKQRLRVLAIQASNSLEKMLAHQMGVAHTMAMKFAADAQDERLGIRILGSAIRTAALKPPAWPTWQRG